MAAMGPAFRSSRRVCHITMIRAVCLTLLLVSASLAKRPNIFMFVADDLGYYNVGEPSERGRRAERCRLGIHLPSAAATACSDSLVLPSQGSATRWRRLRSWTPS